MAKLAGHKRPFKASFIFSKRHVLMTAISNFLEASIRMKKYIQNASWMMGEKVFTIMVTFLVSVAVARYLGPENYGIFSYAISIVAIFASVGHMGLAGLVVRELVKHPDQSSVTLGTTFLLKLLGMGLGLVLILLYALLFENESNSFYLMLLVAASVLLMPFEVIDYWFQSKVQAKYSAIAKMIALLSSGALKVAVVFYGYQLFALGFAHLMQYFLAAALLAFLYWRSTGASVLQWRASWIKGKSLLGEGWMIYVGSIFAIIYLKIDQVMLKWLVDAESVGVYSVAAQISESWYFLPVAIVASIFPKLIKVHESDPEKFNSQLQKIFDFLFLLALLIAILTTALSDWVIISVFGEEYKEAASILVIHVWAGVFMFMRALFSRWILIENALMFSLISQGLGALINIILNMLLIPRFHGEGAAISTLISYAIASYGALFVHPKTRPVFFMMTKALFIPRYFIVIWKSRRETKSNG